MEARPRSWVPTVMILAMALVMASGSIWRSQSVSGQDVGIAPHPTKAPGEAPFGMAKRIAWTGNHVTGSPEPPLPYVVERAFPKIAFKNLVDLAFTPGGKRIFAVEQEGRIYSFANDPSVAKAELAIDLKAEVRTVDKVPEAKGIGSAFAMTFHPKFSENHFCYVTYLLEHKTWGQHLKNGTRVSRFTVTQSDPPRLDPASEVVLIDWTDGGHNGGCLQFGPDGCLYISSGDGADPNPPDGFYHTGQDISDLMSSVLRIDVDHPAGGKPYSVPADNPFVNTPGARPEVFAYGLRNPWKMSFDRATGQLWAGDVGWELWEMVDRVVSGGNYGWSITEGPQPVYPDAKRGPTPIIKPDLVLPHTESASVTGGYVYRGKKLPELAGHYVYGDWETRRVWAAKVEGPGGTKLAPYRQIAQSEIRVIGFAQQADGELLIGDYEGGGVYRLAPNPDANRPSTFPRKLSETGLFADVSKHEPARGVLPFTINAAQWNDGATADRLLAVPGEEPVGQRVDWDGQHLVFPKDSVLVRTFSLRADPANAATAKRVETQLMHFDGHRWSGYTYQWADDQSDATLVDAKGAQKTVTLPDPKAPGGRVEKAWHFASRAQCMTCHTSWTDYTLAYNLAQLDRPVPYGDVTDNQIRSLRHVGLLPPPPGEWKSDDGKIQPPPPAPRPLTEPFDATASLDARARAYLHVNCSHCHRKGGGGSAMIDLRNESPPDVFNAIDVPPMLGALDIADARLVAPGDPGRSVLLCRMAKLGNGRMPHIGSYEVDARGVALLTEWIRQTLASQHPRPVDPKVAGAREQDAKALQALCAARVSSPAALAAADRLLASTSGGLSLATSIDEGKLAPSVREAVIARASANSWRDTVRDLYRPFLAPDKAGPPPLGPDFEPAAVLALKGDAARGRQVFFEMNGGLCQQCHQVKSDGQKFGPDLTQIGKKYDKAQLLENIVNPSAKIDPPYITYQVKTTKGEDLFGLITERTQTEIVLLDLQRQTVRIPLADVKETKPQKISAMAEGLLNNLTAQQAADLIQFLSDQK